MHGSLAASGNAGLAALFARLDVARVFFMSGLMTRLRDRETTVALFADEYEVQLLPLAL